MWDIMCSAPLVGLELPAMLMDTPDTMIGLMASHTLSSTPGFISSDASRMDSAANMESEYADLLKSTFLSLLAKSQSLRAVRLDMTSAQPDARRR